MKHKFRLVFSHSRPGFFKIDKDFIDYPLNEHLTLRVCPRDSGNLKSASSYHLECGGFSSIEEAKECGEKLRVHLKLLNCIFDLGLLIPSIDETSARVSEEVRIKVREETGAEIIDTIVGLHVYPDDNKHFEHVLSASLVVFPSEPFYVLESLRNTWEKTFCLDSNTAEILEILNLSIRENSPKVKFLITYLAMEQIIKREMRSEEAQNLINVFIKEVNSSLLSDSEKSSLSGSLGHLKEKSFSSAFISFSKLITSPEKIYERTVTQFASDCIKLRNKIAHNAAISALPNIEEYTKHLRSMAMSILWTQHGFPSISLHRPADKIEMEKMEIRML